MRHGLIAIAAAAVIAAAVVISCNEERYTPVSPPVNGPTPKSLTVKDDVLYNLELLFNKFDDAEYDKLLDDDFVFFFSGADFSSGKTPAQWDRSMELTSYSGFYDPNRVNIRVIGRSLRLTYPEDNWTKVTPDDPVQYPGESWYVTTVTYNMSVDVDAVPSLTLVSNDNKLEVTIRWDPDEGHYRMIRWRDDVDGGLLAALSKTAAVEDTTWGGIKALFQ